MCIYLNAMYIFYLGDTTPPTVTCPADQSETSSTGEPIAVVYANPATATDDNGGTVTFTYLPASGSSFDLGTTEVTATASDPSGNEATCTFDVIVTSGMNFIVH